jgi:hypothetical protein
VWRLKTALRWRMPAAQRQRIQMVLLRESGLTPPAIAAGLGVSLSTVNRAHMAYDHGGRKALKPRRGVNGANSLAKTALRAGCSQLARRLSGPAFACMGECAHFVKAEQPRNLGYM